MAGHARVYDRRAGAWREVSGPPGPEGPPAPRKLEPSEVEELLAVVRSVGVEPHGYGAGADAEMAAELLGAVPSAAAGESSRPPALGEVLLGGATTTEDVVPPQERLGVAESIFPSNRNTGTVAAPVRADATVARVYGDYTQVVRDVAEMGAGRVRRVKKCDLYWGSLFPVPGTEGEASSFQDGIAVLPPANLQAAMRADGYAVFSHVASFLVACRLAGVRVSLTPFNAGGGAKYTLPASQSSADLAYARGVTFTDVKNGKPSWFDGLLLVGSQGWGAWYWDHSGAPAADTAFHQFAISVWPGRALDGDGNALPGTPYEQECERRKSLGVAAYAEVVAEWLSLLHIALVAWDPASPGGIYEVVDYVELGNELDGIYDGIPNDTSATAVENSRNAALAAGKYMALLAGPIATMLPGMKFRASEIVYRPSKEAQNAGKAGGAEEGISYPADATGCPDTDPLPDAAAWMVVAAGEGISDTLGEWVTYQALEYAIATGVAPASPHEADARAWIATCTAAGYHWPGRARRASDFVSLRARELVHEVGFHWYAMHDVTQYGQVSVPLYRDQERLAAAVSTIQTVLVAGLAARGYNVTISVGEFSFPADYQNADALDANKADEAPAYLHANDIFQASMLARLVAALVSSGVRHVHWFCHLLAPTERTAAHTFAQWPSPVMLTAIRNDIYDRGESTADFATTHAYRRPAWFAYRRLAWLLDRAEGRWEVTRDRGATVLGLRLWPAITRAPDGTELGGSYNWAWLVWIDQYADSTCLHGSDAAPSFNAFVRLAGVTGSRSEPRWLSLCPRVTVDPASTSLDSAGYRAVDGVDWAWVGWDAALMSATAGLGGRDEYIVKLEKAHPLYAPAPLCLLTRGAATVTVEWA